MAFVDMAFLRKRDLSGGEIHYVRRKTGQLMTVRLETCMREIIRRYEWRTRSTPYVFPAADRRGARRAYAQYQVALNYYNRQLKRLSQRLGFEAVSRPTRRATAGRRRRATTGYPLRSSARAWDTPPSTRPGFISRRWKVR